MTNGTNQHPAHALDCPKTRLAEGGLAAIDLCSCGMLQLHIGALTLRMTPCALSELVSTLGEAVAAFASREFEGASLSLRQRRERGDA